MVKTSYYKQNLNSHTILKRYKLKFIVHNKTICIPICQIFQKSTSLTAFKSHYRFKKKFTPRSEYKKAEEYEKIQVIPAQDPILKPVREVKSTSINYIGDNIWTIAIVSMITLTSVCGTFITFMFYIKPLLDSIADTCKATEKAAVQLENAAIEIEEAANLFGTEMPEALVAVEKASKEFEELGSTLNRVFGKLSRKSQSKVKERISSRRINRNRKSMGEESFKDNIEEDEYNEDDVSINKGFEIVPVTKNIRRQTLESVGKMASDITSLAKGLVPSVNMWQKKIRGIIHRLEVQKRFSNKFKERDMKSLKAPEENLKNIKEKEEIYQVMNKYDDEDEILDDDDYFESIDSYLREKGNLIDKILPNDKKGAVVIIEALYRAEMAAEYAAKASGRLQEAVEHVTENGYWDSFSEAYIDEDSTLNENNNGVDNKTAVNKN